MKSQVWAIAIALLSGFLFALASVVQQKAAAQVPDDEARGGRVILQLVRRPMWLLGIACDTVGYIAQAVALAIGSLLVVQPLLVTTLLFALPLGHLFTGRRVYRSDLAWAIGLTVALGVFIDVGQPSVGVDTAPLRSWLPPLIALGVVVAVSLAMARAHQKGRLRALLLAVAAGTLFGVSSALTKSVVDVFDNPLGQAIPELLTSWESYVLGAAMGLGFVLQQSAYQAGNLIEALPATVVLDPVVSVALGVIVLQEALKVHSVSGVTALVASVVVMLAGTIQLSRSAAQHDPAAAL